MVNKIKWLTAVLLLVGGIAGFYYFAQASLLVRVPALLVAVGIAAVVALQTPAGRHFLVFVRESQFEVRKVVWPTGKETAQTTLVVTAMVMIVAVFLWMLDMFLLWSVRVLTGQGG
jgi:preprotein translocase subunit SecE